MLHFARLVHGVLLGEKIAAEMKQRWLFSVLVMLSAIFLKYDTTQSLSVSMHLKKLGTIIRPSAY